MTEQTSTILYRLKNYFLRQKHAVLGVIIGETIMLIWIAVDNSPSIFELRIFEYGELQYFLQLSLAVLSIVVTTLIKSPALSFVVALLVSATGTFAIYLGFWATHLSFY